MGRIYNILRAGTAVALCASSTLAQSTGPITTTTPIPFTFTDFTGSLLFPQFNASLGTLDSVTLDYSSTLSSTFTIANNSGTLSSAGKAATELQVSIEDAGDNFIGSDPQLDISSTKFQFSLAPGASTNKSISISGDSGALTYTATPILSEFTGSGSDANKQVPIGRASTSIQPAPPALALCP